MFKVFILLIILCQFTEFGVGWHRRRFSRRIHSVRRNDRLTTAVVPAEEIVQANDIPVTNEPEGGFGDEESFSYIPGDEVEDVTSISEEGNGEQEPMPPASEESENTIVSNEEEATDFVTKHGLPEYPFIVAVANKAGGHLCGGVIFSDKHVLTAASCLCNWNHPPDPTQLEVETITDMPSTDKYPVKVILCHPGYYGRSDHVHDIGMLTITTSFKFNDRVSQYQFEFEEPNTLTTENEFSLVDIVWSIIKTRRNNDIHMENVLLLSTDRIVCEFAAYPLREKNHAMIKLNDWDICTIEQHGSCNGVVGCPIMNNKKLVGIVTKSMCNEKLKGIYSFINLPYHFDWIKSAMSSIYINPDRRRHRKN